MSLKTSDFVDGPGLLSPDAPRSSPASGLPGGNDAVIG
jgi:hypothetical protein